MILQTQQYSQYGHQMDSSSFANSVSGAKVIPEKVTNLGIL